MGIIVFDDGELEISLVTYCRPDFISHILNETYLETAKRNIRFKIRDSSPDQLTEDVVKEFNTVNKAKVEYYRVDPSVNIGYKPVLSIQGSESKYVWTCADSFYFDYEKLDEKVFPYVKNGVDFIVLYSVNDIREGIYTDKTEIIHDLFVPITCFGATMFKTELFSYYLDNSDEMQRVEELYKDCYGFAVLGYYYDALARDLNCRVSYSCIDLINVSKAIRKKKVQTWAKRFYECWVFELDYIIKSLSDCYKDKDRILSETWEKMKLDSWEYCYRASKGDLNPETFRKLSGGGILQRITKKPERIRFFAYAPDWCIELAYRIRKYAIVYPNALVKKVKRIIKSG